jgi:NADPH2:quinone reductase
MRAVQVSAFGDPEVLRVTSVPDAVAGTGEVVVDVEVAGVLSIDAVIRRGDGAEHFPVELPYVPGVGAAGRVSAVGVGVDAGWLDRRVLADVEGGAYAERVSTPVGGLIPIPDALGSREAMALLHDGSTALAVFEAVGVRRGETVLVQPAGGGLGSLLVQLAHGAGARVVAAARGARKLDLAKQLGADVVVDYSDPDWTDQVREFGDPDVVFDGVGGELGRAAFELTARGGRFSSYGFAGGAPTSVDEEQARERGLSMLGMEQLIRYAPDRKRRAERMLHAAAQGRVTPFIGQTFPLERAAEAHAAIETRGIVGKTMLVV